MQAKQLKLGDIKGDIMTYFRWSLHALYPAVPHEADRQLIQHRETIRKVAQELLRAINYMPTPIYRGVIFREPITQLNPHRNFQYLSFSEDQAVAKHFASVSGFGSNIGILNQNIPMCLSVENTPSILLPYRFPVLLLYSSDLKTTNFGDHPILGKQKCSK